MLPIQVRLLRTIQSRDLLRKGRITAIADLNGVINK